MKLPSLVLILVLGSIPVYAQNEPAERRVLRAWSDTFRSIHSLDSKSRTTLFFYNTPNASKSSSNGFIIRQQLLIDGRKYRAVADNPSSNVELTTSINAYDGENYQVLNGNSSTSLLISRKKEVHNPSPYLGGIPLTWMFDFAFAKGDAKTLETLQTPSTWTYLTKRITEFKPTTRNGKPGYLMVVKPFVQSSSSLGKKTVFIDSTTLLPSFCEEVTATQGTGEVLRYQLLRTTPSGLSSLKEVPSDLIVETYSKGELVNKMTIETQTLRLNTPIPSQVFAIPKSQAKTVTTDVDIDKRSKQLRKIFAEQKAAKEKAKEKAKQERP
jgi:hypothetical protein